MRSASVAEWIISRFTDRERAAAVVGDLLESLPEQSFFGFWYSIAEIVLSLTWRRPIAFAVAYFVGLRSLGALQFPLFGMYAGHRPPHAWMPAFAALSAIGVLLWTMSPYAVIRFGVRDRFSRLVTAFALVVAGLIYFWWVPAVSLACLAVIFAISVMSMASALWRRTLLAVAGATVIALCGCLALLYFNSLYESHLFPEGMPEIRLHVFVTLPVLAIFCITSVCSYTHRVFLSRTIS